MRVKIPWVYDRYPNSLQDEQKMFYHERNEDIVNLWLQLRHQSNVAKVFGMSRERVRQVLYQNTRSFRKANESIDKWADRIK